MPVRSVVLVNESSLPLSVDRFREVARALQIQVVRDFEPVWEESASVSALTGTQVPAGAWPIRLVDQSTQLGVHMDEGRHPYAVVRASIDWTITMSHELLEMLANPEGDKTVEGPDIDPDHSGRRVEYLLEVCDACQVYDYPVGTVPVSDFVMPEYFRPERTAAGAKMDLLGRIGSPLQVHKGCHLSWWDPQDRSWHQRLADGRFVRDAPSEDEDSLREDRDSAFSTATGGLPHDLSAARRSMRRDAAETALHDLFTSDPRMRQIIARAADRHGWDRGQTDLAAREYRRHLLLRYLHPGLRIAALNRAGDLLWHEHIIDTEKYRHDCERIFGEIVDHQPFYDEPQVPADQDPDVLEAAKVYEHEFGAGPPELARTSG
jgi:hypothetical protein